MCSAAGSFTQEDVDPQERKGALWDTYRRLVEEGWTPDVHSYTTSFRPVLSPQTSCNILVYATIQSCEGSAGCARLCGQCPRHWYLCEMLLFFDGEKQ